MNRLADHLLRFNSIGEHEEITRVKNFNFIELGRFRMETWYFSPLPKEYWKDDVTETV